MVHTISHLPSLSLLYLFPLPSHSLIDTLKGPGPFTVFAPTDEAFGKIDPATLNAILADQAKLTSILTYHVVSGTSPSPPPLFPPSPIQNKDPPLPFSPVSFPCTHSLLPPSLPFRPCARR